MHGTCIEVLKQKKKSCIFIVPQTWPVKLETPHLECFFFRVSSPPTLSLQHLSSNMKQNVKSHEFRSEASYWFSEHKNFFTVDRLLAWSTKPHLWRTGVSLFVWPNPSACPAWVALPGAWCSRRLSCRPVYSSASLWNKQSIGLQEEKKKKKSSDLSNEDAKTRRHSSLTKKKV